MWPFVGWGILLWAVAAVAIRVGGQVVLVPDAPVRMGVLYLVTVPAMAGVALLLYRLYGVGVADRARGAVGVVLPVAVLDAAALSFYGVLFPNLAAETARLFAVWVLVAYVGVFVTIFVGRGGE
jgi:hypothetical protein